MRANFLKDEVPYLETNRVISFANDIFGYGGWASQIVNLSVDYVCETVL
jgi:recombination DNA repair RAD52 pathway protein